MSVTLTGQTQAPAAVETKLTAVPPKRRLKLYGLRWTLFLALSDITMFLLAAYFAAEVVKVGQFQASIHNGIVLSAIVYAGFWLLLFERLGLYRRSFAMSMRDELYAATAALVLGVTPQLLLFTIVPSVSTSRSILLLSFVFAVLTVGGTRALLHAFRDGLADRYPSRVAVVGSRHRVEAALESLNFGPGTRLLTLFEDDVEDTLRHVNLTHDADLKNIGWLRQVRAWGADTILLTEILPPHVLPHLLEVIARERTTLAFAPPRLCAHAYDYGLRTDGHQALIVPFRLGVCRMRARVAKRVLDLVLGTLALVIAAPVMLLAALAIALESGRPIFFTQERVGMNGRIFNVLKFRTMRVDAEAVTGPVWAKRHDPRLTRFGALLRRTSVDELPQLLNVLRGEMSLVGPRPERPVFVDEFRRQLPRYDERHLVRPGITGWSQVHMKRVLDVADVSEKLSHDLFYVENWSLFMDVSVLIKTAFEFLFHRAA